MKMEITVAPQKEPEWAPKSEIVQVLRVPKLMDGPSPRGSTYWTRFLTCPREARLAEILRPFRTTQALSTGFAWHLALEMFYTAWMEGANYVAAQEAGFAAIAPLKESGEECYVEMYELLARMLTAYFRQYESDFQHWMILAVEETLGVSEPMEYTARLDLVIMDKRTLAIWPTEHKSARALQKTIVEGYQLNLQVLGQAYLFEKCVDTKELGGVYSGVNVSITTKHKPTKKNAEPTQFMRIPVLPSPDHLRAFESSIIRWTRLREVFEQEGYPPDFSKCSGFARGYGQCAYFRLCYERPNMDLGEIAALAEAAQGEPEKLPSGFIPVTALTRHLEERNSES